MAASPRWKVYRDGKYVASCKDIVDAITIVQTHGDELRDGHSPNGRVGFKSQLEMMSYDEAVEHCTGAATA